MKHFILATFLFTACTDAASGPDDAPPFVLDDGGSPILDDAGNPIPVPTDAGATPPPPPTGYAVLPTNCVDYVHDHHWPTGGSPHDLTTGSYATFNLAPGDDFLLTTCQPHVPLPCPSGTVPPIRCMGDNAPPTMTVCQVQRGGGTFRDGKLVVQCGASFRRVSATPGVPDSMVSGWTQTVTVSVPL